MCCFPGGGASLQRHRQLFNRHCHRPVRSTCLLPRCLPPWVQTTTYHHQAPAWVYHTSCIFSHVSFGLSFLTLPQQHVVVCLQVLWLISPSTPSTVYWQRWTKVNSTPITLASSLCSLTRGPDKAMLLWGNFFNCTVHYVEAFRLHRFVYRDNAATDARVHMQIHVGMQGHSRNSTQSIDAVIVLLYAI